MNDLHGGFAMFVCISGVCVCVCVCVCALCVWLFVVVFVVREYFRKCNIWELFEKI